jgi:predicted double-glycine peptidase
MRLSLPFVRQSNDYYCGPAALGMIFANAGLTRSQRQMAEILHTRPRFGTRRSALVRAARANGFRVKSWSNATLDQLKNCVKRDIPVIVNYRETDDDISHFAVVSGFEHGRILLHDPWHGKYTSLSEAEFVRRWYGKHRLVHKRWACAIWKP